MAYETFYKSTICLYYILNHHSVLSPPSSVHSGQTPNYGALNFSVYSTASDK